MLRHKGYRSKGEALKISESKTLQKWCYVIMNSPSPCSSWKRVDQSFSDQTVSFGHNGFKFGYNYFLISLFCERVPIGEWFSCKLYACVYACCNLGNLVSIFGSFVVTLIKVLCKFNKRCKFGLICSKIS